MITFCALAYAPISPMAEAMMDSSGPVVIGVPTTFTCFPRLPIELRLRIWGFACYLTRNVDLGARIIEPPYFFSPEVFQYTSTSPPPAVLHTCCEARKEGLKHYWLTFGLTFDLGKGATVNTEPRIYYNCGADRICIARGFEHDAIGDLEYYGIQKIAINVPATEEESPASRTDWISEYPYKWFDGSLEEVVIFNHEPSQGRLPARFDFEEISDMNQPDKTLAERFEKFRKNLEECMDEGFEEFENQRRGEHVREQYRMLFSHSGKPFPRDFSMGTVGPWKWEPPAIKVMRVKGAEEA